MARVLDGRAVATTWQEELARDVRDVYAKGGRPPGLGVILVGSRPDSLLYVTRKREACERVGMFAEVRQLSGSVTQRQLETAVAALCADPRIDGVLVQLPLPRHIDEEAIIENFDPQKDVDGFHPLNMGRILMRGRAARFIPCTALGVIELLQRSSVAVRGKSVVVMGDSNIVGMPLAMLFRDAGAATQDLPSITRTGDILVVAVGYPQLVKREWVKPGAVVIDVGVNVQPWHVVGDVDFWDVAEVASALTPVPGGVGPMTIAAVLHNTVQAARYNLGLASYAP
ncbi:hypothetical protein CHLNCDRAFT_48501 [Chlorella variabilis]|uniref:methenyltetrahydrofolate cyclohydrolase n=1 Tax=Chlorella variabilis TaxID=554065 RepID=E1Z6M5_CHLVA|nr:hypothetical protein CHLNCDRAFT_48501 [Chlorella variabilis]EFN58676.1 hypothetical protein CHLNCDRAFT_48501 [Chlorella variabilis]|eukprot:XP_005850778.1 hypothetical protein CHLNCDRAFT_48501 [Chlorella variabilis]